MKENIIRLRKDGKTYNEIKNILGCSKGTISYHCKKLKLNSPIKKLIKKNIIINKKKKKITNCLCCKKIIPNRNIFCSRKCKDIYNRDIKITKWLNGEHDGMRGNTATAAWIKTWLISKYGEKCSKCGWKERNEKTGKIPIELNHIDGNFRNNNPVNLELLCPNCHSLTESYKSLNSGNGRPRK